MRFHLIARTKDNKDELLYEFNEEYQFDYYMSLVDKDYYKSAVILDYSTPYPTCPMSVDFRDNTPYFEKYKKRELKKNDRKNIR